MWDTSCKTEKLHSTKKRSHTRTHTNSASVQSSSVWCPYYKKTQQYPSPCLRALLFTYSNDKCIKSVISFGMSSIWVRKGSSPCYIWDPISSGLFLFSCFVQDWGWPIWTVFVLQSRRVKVTTTTVSLGFFNPIPICHASNHSPAVCAYIKRY